MLRILLTILGLFAVSAHNYGTGTCPNVRPIPNLSLKKFLGGWFVIEQFDTSSKCLKFTYEAGDSDTNIKVTKSRKFGWIDQLDVDHTSEYAGSLDVPFADNQGFMRVKWPLNIAGKGDYYVMDTDYVTYALVYDCQNLVWFHRDNAAILSRTPTLDQIIIDKMKKKLKAIDVDTSEFDVVSHEGCNNSSDMGLKLNFHEDTLENAFNTAADTVKDAAKEAAKGIEGVANTLSNAFANDQDETSELKEKVPKK